MNYQLTGCGVLRLSDAAYIPQDTTNRDWLEYQQWLLSGGQVLPANEPPNNPALNSPLKTLANKWLARSNRQP
ncbi:MULTISPECIES: hypothetical protein [Pseudomonas]|uniref:hypothetical protein n=1 Tax=Pseudomonas TaxID=286 RepID=UPI00215B98F5|nr:MULTISPECIES: hypothetical protein [unclassified Pseudomonas]MCR8932739.1 hypothetical protein [Pseudomonas sp. S11A4]MCR8976343.1 hypothetical protein [Pseudomonas sp. S11P7]